MRNKFLIGIIFFAVLATQFSCSQIRQTELEHDRQTKPEHNRQTEFERNRNLWRESKITNYKMTIKIDKTGHATPNGTFIITVRGGVAKSIRSVNSGVELVSSDVRFEGFETIEDIFNFIESAEKDKQKNNNPWNRREIEYDAKFGYPKKVDLDQSGVFDDELYFEVLEFEVIESSGGEPAEKSSPPKLISVPATEITRAEISDQRRAGSENGYANWSGMSFSNDGTAYRANRSLNFGADDIEGEWEKFQGVASQQQFQKFAQILADNDFSNLKDSTDKTTGMTWYVIITYSGKTKTIKTSSTRKNTAEMDAILQAFETLKNQLDWKEVK